MSLIYSTVQNNPGKDLGCSNVDLKPLNHVSTCAMYVHSFVHSIMGIICICIEHPIIFNLIHEKAIRNGNPLREVWGGFYFAQEP